MKRKIATFLVCLSILFVGGCRHITDYSSYGDSSNGSQNVQANVKNFPQMEEGYALYGATATLEGVYAGWEGGVPVTIVNGHDQARTFHLSLQQPGQSIREDYEPFPTEYFGWFVISDIKPEAGVGDTIEVPVTLTVPEELPEGMEGVSYEIRILVEDWSQTGFVQLALQEKWLITFAE